MADTHNEAEVKRDYPVTTGITADAKHEGRQANLVAEGLSWRDRNVTSIVPSRTRKGID